MPASRHSAWSSGDTLAVRATIGTLPAGPGMARIRRATSNPLMPGMKMSMNTRS